MLNRVIGLGYAIVGIALVVTLAFGATAPLSFDWWGRMTEAAWRWQPLLCLIGVAVLGGLCGRRVTLIDVASRYGSEGLERDLERVRTWGVARRRNS